MANIGNFNQAGESYIGKLETLTVNLQATLEPVTDKKREKFPDFRLFAGTREIGAAWKRTTQEGAEFLSVIIEDPVFPAPVNCRLVKSGIEGRYALIWSRN
jgi:uncharacterized protein (DUF736 family)